MGCIIPIHMGHDTCLMTIWKGNYSFFVESTFIIFCIVMFYYVLRKFSRCKEILCDINWPMHKTCTKYISLIYVYV